MKLTRDSQIYEELSKTIFIVHLAFRKWCSINAWLDGPAGLRDSTVDVIPFLNYHLVS